MKNFKQIPVENTNFIILGKSNPNANYLAFHPINDNGELMPEIPFTRTTAEAIFSVFSKFNFTPLQFSGLIDKTILKAVSKPTNTELIFVLPSRIQHLYYSENSKLKSGLYSLPNLNGSIPSCLGQLRNVYILSFENLAGVSGEIPWNTFRKTFSQSTINGKTLLLGLRLSISRTNFTGNLLPSRFPKNCRLTYIYIKVNHASLPIRISPTISRCPLVNIKIEGKAFAGDLPPEICGMCTLEEFDLGYSDTMQAVLKDVSTFSTESVDWLHRNCTNAERKRRCGKKKPKSWVTSFRKLRVQCFNVNPKCGLCHCKGDSSYTFAPLTSGNFTIGSAYANTNNGNWNPLTLVTITLSGTVLKTLMAGAVKYQVYQTAVPSFISSGSSNYFTCDNMECDLAKPIALTLDTPSKPNGSRYTLQFDFVIPEKVGQSNEFRVVIWGQDENHSLNDFTTTLKFKLG